MDEDELARNLGIGARGNLPVPSSPRPYPLGWRSWPWKRIALSLLAMVAIVGTVVLVAVVVGAYAG
jgi:hypothetical protein